MKKNSAKKSIMVILVFLLILTTAIPAFAASATVDVRFVVKNQQGPYKGVSIQFGKNTKTTGSRGTCEFRLEGIPNFTMVNAFLTDPNVPSGYNCMINLELGANQKVKVNDAGPGASNIHIMYTENTKTIVIEYSVGSNNNYGYKKATFEKKLFSKPSASKPKNPQPPPAKQPQQPQPPQHDPPPPPEGQDPDMHPEEFHEDMPPEEYQEEFHEDMPPEEFREDMPPEEFGREPYREQMMPGYVWIIIAVGALLFITVVVLIAVVARKKKE
jgi:hypothetical protein